MIPELRIPEPSFNQEMAPIERCDEDALKVIFLTKRLYSPPFIVNKSFKDIRLTVHVLMTVSKKWRRIMHELIVPLLNSHTIRWSDLPLVKNDKALTAPNNPIRKFLLQPERASLLMRLDLRGIKDIHSDRVGEIIDFCKNVQTLFLSYCYFDLRHLTKLPKLKVFWITESNLLNTGEMKHCSTLENISIEKCSGVYWDSFNSKLQKLAICSQFTHNIQTLPHSLTSLTLSNAYLTADNPLQSLTLLKHLSMNNPRQLPPLDKLESLESLEIACDLLPEGYLENASQVKRLKISKSNNLPKFDSFDNLTQLFLNSIHYPSISVLTKITELKMEECLYSSETFAQLKNLRKLTLKNHQWESRYTTLVFNDLPNMEMLHINSFRLVNISARALTSLRNLTINCKSIQELVIPVQIAHLDISKLTRHCYRETEYKVMKF